MIVVSEKLDLEDAHVLIVGSASEILVAALHSNELKVLVAPTIESAKSQIATGPKISVVVANLPEGNSEFLAALRRENTLVSLVLCLNTDETALVVERMNTCRPDHTLNNIEEIVECTDRIKSLIMNPMSNNKCKTKTKFRRTVIRSILTFQPCTANCHIWLKN